MGLIALSRDNFRAVVGTDQIVLVECRAPDCGVCTRFDRVFTKVAQLHPAHAFASMDVMEHEDLGSFFEIEHTPTLMVYREGLLLFKKPGNFSEEELSGIIRQVESLDMKMVRADLAAESESDQTYETESLEKEKEKQR